MVGRTAPTAIDLSAAPWSRPPHREDTARLSVRASSDRLAPSRSATPLGARQFPLPDAGMCGGEVSSASSPLIVVCTRVNGLGRATRAWIDRTKDGLSGCPPTATACREKRDFGTSRWGGSRSGYINGATGRKGYDRLWHEPAESRWAEHVRSAPSIQTSICSAIPTRR